MRILAAGVTAIALTWCAGGAAQASITTADILQRVSEGVSPEVGFREVRTTRLLKTPLRSSGVLRFVPPNRLERETLQPVQESIVIEDLQVTIERGGAQTVISLASGSAPATMAETLRAVLGGRTRELEARYRATAMGTSEGWSLSLEPRTADGAILSIRLSGRGANVDEIEVRERSGDKTVTQLVR